MRTLKIILSIVSFLIFYSCNNYYNVIPVKEASTSKRYAPIYALPAHEVYVDVVVEKVQYFKGPYAEFSEKYLSIPVKIKNDYSYYRIKDIKFSTRAFPDKKHVYFIDYKRKNDLNLVLNSQGLIQGVNIDEVKVCDNKDVQSFIYKDFDNAPDNPFTDYSIKRNFFEKQETSYEIRIMSDSSFVRVPKLNTKVARKNLEDKAEDAANFIIKMRKRRFKVEVGQYEKFPEGDALKYMSKRIDELEQEYLSLFLGKKVSLGTVTYRMKFSPNNEVDEKVMAYFSEDKGLSYINQPEQKPLILQINYESEYQLDSLSFRNPDNLPKFKGLKYRLAEKSLLRLKHNGRTLAEDKLVIGQFCKVNTLSQELLQEKKKIYFDVHTGALLRVTE